MKPSDEVRAELERLLDEDQTKLGGVFRGDREGLDGDQIASKLGVRTSGFVSNKRTIVRAMLEGRLPSGPAIKGQVASAIRAKLKRSSLSPEARAHLTAVLAELESRRASQPQAPLRPTVAAAPTPNAETGSLRQAVDTTVRERLLALIATIEADTGISTDDYRSVLGETFALDGIAHLLLRNTSSPTTEALCRQGAPQLTLDQAVLDWSADLPISAELTGYARGRLDYWSSR